MSRLLYACVVLVIVDGVMTLPHWQLEGNPVVLALGPGGMLLAKLTAAVAMWVIWTRWDGVRDHLVARASLVSLTALYGIVVGSNLIVLAAGIK